MRVYTHNLVIRIGATFLAAGYAAVGLYAVQASWQAPTAYLADRAFWLGVTFLIAGFLAFAVSWLVADLSNIWCIPPRKTPQPRLRMDDEARTTEARGSRDVPLRQTRKDGDR